MTPPHSTGIYYLFGFFLFGILFASWCSRRRLVVVRPSEGPPSRNRSLVVVCCMLCVYVWGVGTVRCSRSRALFPAYVSCVVSVCCLGVLSRCVVSAYVSCMGLAFCLGVSLLCLESRVCLRTLQSISCLTYILSHVFMLSVTRPL